MSLGRGSCQVWWARPSSRLADYVNLLDPIERVRAATYRHELDRSRFIVGCVVSRLVLARLLCVPAARIPLDRRCRQCGAQHGPPRLHDEPITLSVSHSDDRVAVAFVRHALIGVDVEATRRLVQPEESLLRTVLAPTERAHVERLPASDQIRAFLTYWTRKESVIKATGDGLAAHLPAVVVSAPDQPPRLITYEARALPESTRMASLHPGRGYVGAVAVIGDGPVAVTELDAETLLVRPSVQIA